ncbi:conserved hypothetical protein [Paraburkholderia caribensis]|uniref:hypothetical protein n=1 Tax=Paraburkholderia caribensis TaxID=75105 RepID=UPI001CADBEB1|nr:hypothetical protein [Paraburkholderia caribensis]CAG9238642.1 conserved hypothetical protein [Paraburkholderia caribensis]
MDVPSGWPLDRHLAGNRRSGPPRAISSEAGSEFHIVRFAWAFSVVIFLLPESMFYMAKSGVYLIEK